MRCWVKVFRSTPSYVGAPARFGGLHGFPLIDRRQRKSYGRRNPHIPPERAPRPRRVAPTGCPNRHVANQGQKDAYAECTIAFADPTRAHLLYGAQQPQALGPQYPEQRNGRKVWVLASREWLPPANGHE